MEPIKYSASGGKWEYLDRCVDIFCEMPTIRKVRRLYATTFEIELDRERDCGGSNADEFFHRQATHDRTDTPLILLYKRPDRRVVRLECMLVAVSDILPRTYNEKHRNKPLNSRYKVVVKFDNITELNDD